MERKGGLLFLVFVALSLSAATTNATIVIIELTGEITEVAFSKWGNTEIRVGDQITGFYTYDTEAYDEDPLPTVGSYRYSSPPYGITLTVNGLLFQSDPGNVDFYVKVFNNFPTEDRVTIVSHRNLPTAGIPIDSIWWELEDWSGVNLSNTDLPQGPLILGEWDPDPLYVSVFLGGRPSSGLFATVTSVRLIPEPNTLMLLTFGAMAVTLRARKSSGV